MRVALAVVMVLGSLSLACGQACNPACAGQPAACCAPQSDLFMAYESSTHNSPLFRGIVPNTLGAACQVTTDIQTTPEVVVNGPLAPVSVPLAPGVTLNFNLGEGIERWVGIGGPFDGAMCFTPEVNGFATPHVQVTVVDGCGLHLVTIQRPAFFCVTPTNRLVCFQSRNVNGNTLPLPPGFDRPEDVCVVIGP
jgi:hypothetical protein